MRFTLTDTRDAESLAVDGAEPATEPISLAFNVCGDANRKNAVGWAICRSFEGEKGLHLIVTERGIWTSENLHAFDILVRCVAENGLDYKDGGRQGVFELGDHEIDLLEALVKLCLTNDWGFVLGNPARSSIIMRRVGC